jgi:hypothetical protein
MIALLTLSVLLEGRIADMRIVARIAKWSILALVIALVAIQLVPIDRTNPPVETEVPASAEVRSVLRRACYDCHSNETKWPWYTRIAPASWLIAKDTSEGREELNFSTWDRLSAGDQAEAIRKSWETVDEGEMPPWFYLPLHPEARLSADDRVLLRDWAASVGG